MYIEIFFQDENFTNFFFWIFWDFSMVLDIVLDLSLIFGDFSKACQNQLTGQIRSTESIELGIDSIAQTILNQGFFTHFPSQLVLWPFAAVFL